MVAWEPGCVCWGSMIRETSFPDIPRIRVNDPLEKKTLNDIEAFLRCWDGGLIF